MTSFGEEGNVESDADEVNTLVTQRHAKVSRRGRNQCQLQMRRASGVCGPETPFAASWSATHGTFGQNVEEAVGKRVLGEDSIVGWNVGASGVALGSCPSTTPSVLSSVDNLSVMAESGERRLSEGLHGEELVVQETVV